MITIKCKYCGGSVTLTGARHGHCDYCGQELTFPSAQEERTAAMYDRANHFRTLGEFDRAYSAYQHLLKENNEDPELHWSLTLCRYGVEYVEDKRLSQEELGIREYKPTLSRMSFESILEDPDYLAAMQYADDTGKRIYRQEAGKLSRIQQQYLEIARKEAPYDVFISFKAETPDGARTKASELGQDIYEQLTGKGLKVFFSRITLENKLSEMYEPYIFAALHSSKVFLLIADDKDQIQERWVKNEWTRFLSMSKDNRSKRIVPVFNSKGPAHMNPYDFPDEISTAQAQDMAKVGAMQDLIRGVCKLAGQTDNERILVMDGGVTLDNLLRRAKLALRDGEYFEARQLTDKILDVNPENGQAHQYQLLAVNKSPTLNALMNIRLDWQNEKYYKRAKEYADEQLQEEYRQFEEDCGKEKILRQAKTEFQNGQYGQALDLLNKITGYQGASQLAAECAAQNEYVEVQDRYFAAIGDPWDYLIRRLQETHPSEAKIWNRLLQEETLSEHTEGKKFALFFSIAMVIFSLYTFVRYDSFDSGTVIAFYWSILAGLTVAFKSEQGNWITRLALPAFGFFILANIFSMPYDDHSVSFYYIQSIGMLLCSLIMLALSQKEGIMDLKRGTLKQRQQEYYQNTIFPIEQKLRQEVHETWAEQIGEENLLELTPIYQETTGGTNDSIKM